MISESAAPAMACASTSRAIYGRPRESRCRNARASRPSTHRGFMSSHHKASCWAAFRSPEDQVTNMTFGGPDKTTLYVTAGKTLFRIQIEVSGWSVFPALSEQASSNV